MQRYVVPLAAAVVAVIISLGVYGGGGTALAEEDQPAAGQAKQTTVTGELIDMACFLSSEGKAKGESHAACARSCMASGIPAGVLPQDAKAPKGAMFLVTNPAPLAQYAGQIVRIEGTVYPDMHAVAPKKVSVKQGDSWKEVSLKDEHAGSGGARGSDRPAQAGGDDHAGHQH